MLGIHFQSQGNKLMKTQLFRFAFLLLIYALIPLTAGAQTVNIPDSNLRAVLETALGKASGDPIIVAEMATLTHLEGDEANINDLTGLEFATNLTWLNLGDNSIRDISAVAGLTNLTALDLDDNSISDIPPLTGLTNLTNLSLSNNPIFDISAIAGLTNLTWLSLSNNSISDISPLARLTTLTGLSLRNNPISDISALAGLSNLKRLFLTGNAISDLSPLTGLINLIDLDLGGNSVSDISPVAELINLIELDLHENSISDLSPLSGLTNLKWLWLEDNSISDISALVTNAGLGDDDIVGLRRNTLNYPSINTYIPALQARGVSVRVDHRTVTTILKISGDQRGFPSAVLPNPFVAEVRDEYGAAYEGVPVTFAITAGSGTLSVTYATTIGVNLVEI